MEANDQQQAAAIGSVQLTFNVTDQQDVAKLLGYVRGSQLDPEDRSHVRDLILDFTHSQDAAILETVNQILTLINVRVVRAAKETTAKGVESTPVKAVPSAPAPFGHARPQPHFNRPKSPPSPPARPTDAGPKAAAAEPMANQPSRPEPAQAAPAPAAAPVPVKIPVAPATGRRATQPASTSVKAPPPTPADQPNVAPPAPAMPPAPPAGEPPADPSAPSAVQSAPESPFSGDPQTRIQEIKKFVNERVGNPVNLIDTNNEVGREYMNALLDAMKKANGGQANEVADAMSRLEQAFTAVQKTLAEQPPPGAEPISHPASPQPVAEVKPAPVPPPPVVPITPTPQKSVPVATPASTPAAPAPEPPTPNIPPVATAPAKPPAASRLHSLAEVDVPAPLPPERPATPVARVEAARAAAADPLNRPEVTAGLEQLLSEWKLFKSSGLFGTGPSGHDHPLYQRLATLPMASIIAGRYEGAAPEIRQSITDYMNGWRYEQGVIHELSETFEHYLRRVIATILEKQSSSKAPA